MLKKFITAIFITTFIPISAYANNITTSILPLQSFVSMVTEGSINEQKNYPKLILKNNTSPHDIELTFSQIKEIKNSDIMFIASKNLEAPLLKYIDNKKTKLIVIDEIKELNLYKFDNTGFNNYLKSKKKEPQPKPAKTSPKADSHRHEHNHNEDHKHGHTHHHDDDINDYHVWLDPIRSKIILKNIALELSKIYPENTKIYNANVQKYSKKLDQLNTDIKKNLKNFNRNSLFFHNGWQYFVKTYNIPYYGTIINHEVGHSHGVNMSAKAYIDLNNYIKENNITCIFSEPEFNASSIAKLNKDNNFKISLLQPIETYNFKDIPTEKDYINIYFELMIYNSKTLSTCY